jgi:hypothetical protein
MKQYCKTERRRGLFSAIEHQRTMASKSTGILKLHDLIPWESFCPQLEELAGYATLLSKGFMPPFDPVLMFKLLVLQKLHGLSDDGTEEQIFDRISFKNFLGLFIGDDIPDAKTPWDFKQSIKAEGPEGGRKLFEAFNQILAASATVGSRTSASRRESDPKSLTKTPPWAPRKTSKPAGRRRTTKSTTAERTM